MVLMANTSTISSRKYGVFLPVPPDIPKIDRTPTKNEKFISWLGKFHATIRFKLLGKLLN